MTLGERRGTPWSGHQSITGLTHRHSQPFTPTGNLESLINLTCMFLVCGKKLEHPDETDVCRPIYVTAHTRVRVRVAEQLPKLLFYFCVSDITQV